ncbi:hypothetical protein V8C26DRAFT_414671 [Trichoderma gracile]
MFFAAFLVCLGLLFGVSGSLQMIAIYDRHEGYPVRFLTMRMTATIFMLTPPCVYVCQGDAMLYWMNSKWNDLNSRMNSRGDDEAREATFMREMA